MQLRSATQATTHLGEAVFACARLVGNFVFVGVVILSLQPRVSLGSQAPDPLRSAQQALESLAQQAQNSLTNADLGTQPLSGFHSGTIPLGGILDPQAGTSPQQYGPDFGNWNWNETAAFGLAIVLGGFLLYRMALSIFEGQLAFGPPVAVDPALSAEQRLAKEAQVEQFIAAFGEPTSEEAVGVPDFPDWAPEQVAELRNLFSEVCRANHAASRQRMFAELSRGLRQVKERASLPGLGPILQLASTLEELFKQLAKKEPTLTASELQTAAAGLDVLHKLCLSASDLEMAADRRVKFLVVDDDAVSRHALSVALKKAFAEPDLVPNGEIALAMATRQSYDVIFLDVEMPGMDGFEICSKILETAPNCTTPDVFVTLHSDFDSRAAGVLSGGRHLIGKPFMPSELAVKALTLAFEARHAFT